MVRAGRTKEVRQPHRLSRPGPPSLRSLGSPQSPNRLGLRRRTKHRSRQRLRRPGPPSLRRPLSRSLPHPSRRQSTRRPRAGACRARAGGSLRGGPRAELPRPSRRQSTRRPQSRSLPRPSRRQSTRRPQSRGACDARGPEPELAAPEPEPAAQPALGVEPPLQAEPPWYDPGDEALDAARAAATPAFTAPEELEPAAPESLPHAASAPAPPNKVAVSGKAASRPPEPPPSQLALRTTQAVLSGVWKRLQKPPDPPR